MCNMSGQCAWSGLQLNYFLHFSSSHNRMGDQFSTYLIEQLMLITPSNFVFRLTMQHGKSENEIRRDYDLQLFDE